MQGKVLPSHIAEMQRLNVLVFVLAGVLCDKITEAQNEANKNSSPRAVYPPLNGYYINALPANAEQTKVWVVRVIHAREGLFPDVCTAVCLQERIFISTAKCISHLKVAYTSVRYKDESIRVLAFVIPSFPTYEMFDDVGFIVVKNTFKGKWDTAPMYKLMNRTDDKFEWFKKLDLAKVRDRAVVGFIPVKGSHKLKPHLIKYELIHLADAHFSLDLCASILSQNNLTGYRVPCYSACSVTQYIRKIRKCLNYVGAPGAAVMLKEQVIGLASWGATGRDEHQPLPVGFIVLNSKAYWEDFECAKRIRDSGVKKVEAGFFQSLCDRK